MCMRYRSSVPSGNVKAPIVNYVPIAICALLLFIDTINGPEMAATSRPPTRQYTNTHVHKLSMK